MGCVTTAIKAFKNKIVRLRRRLRALRAPALPLSLRAGQSAPGSPSAHPRASYQSQSQNTVAFNKWTLCRKWVSSLSILIHRARESEWLRGGERNRFTRRSFALAAGAQSTPSPPARGSQLLATAPLTRRRNPLHYYSNLGTRHVTSIRRDPPPCLTHFCPAPPD